MNQLITAQRYGTEILSTRENDDHKIKNIPGSGDDFIVPLGSFNLCILLKEKNNIVSSFNC